MRQHTTFVRTSDILVQFTQSSQRVLHLSEVLNLTTCNRVLFEKLNFPSRVVMKFPAFYGAGRFFAVFTRDRHRFLSRVKLIHPSCFPTKNLYVLLIFSMHATSTARLIHLDSVILIVLCEE